MKKAILWCFKVSTMLLAFATTIFLIFTYWEKIQASFSEGARVATNVINTFTGDNVERNDPTDYYDI